MGLDGLGRGPYLGSGVAYTVNSSYGESFRNGAVVKNTSRSGASLYQYSHSGPRCGFKGLIALFSFSFFLFRVFNPLFLFPFEVFLSFTLALFIPYPSDTISMFFSNHQLIKFLFWFDLIVRIF